MLQCRLLRLLLLSKLFQAWGFWTLWTTGLWRGRRAVLRATSEMIGRTAEAGMCGQKFFHLVVCFSPQSKPYYTIFNNYIHIITARYMLQSYCLFMAVGAGKTARRPSFSRWMRKALQLLKSPPMRRGMSVRSIHPRCLKWKKMRMQNLKTQRATRQFEFEPLFMGRCDPEVATRFR